MSLVYGETWHAPAKRAIDWTRSVIGVAMLPYFVLRTLFDLDSEEVIGSGLELEGELIQLSAFTSADGGRRAFGRIARPSRRR